MYLNKSIPIFIIAFLLAVAIMPVHAEVVHKWVDAQGVTHYSDQLPKDNANATKQLAISNVYSKPSRVDYREDYHSVTNQWARMREERIERKQLQLDQQLEKNKQKAAQQVVSPQVVYINQAEEDRSRSIYYPAYLGRHKYGNNNFHHYTGKKYGNHYSSRITNRYRGSSCRLPRNSNSGYAYTKRSSSGSGLSLTFR